MIERAIKRKFDKLYVKCKGYDNSFNSWIDKKRYCYIKMSYFLPYSHSKNKTKFELGLSNYAKKSELKKNATGVDTSQFAKKDDLADLKSEVDNLDIDKLAELNADKLKLVPTALCKLSDVVKNGVVKKKDYNGKIKNIKDKIPTIIHKIFETNSSFYVKQRPMGKV